MVIYLDGLLPIQNAVVTNFTTSPFVAADGIKKIVGEFFERKYSPDGTVMISTVPVTMIVHVSKISNITE